MVFWQEREGSYTGIIVKPNNFAASTPAVASQVNANFDVIYNAFNGNIDSNNLASNSVVTSKIADNNVTTAKINDAAVTTTKINNLAVTTDKLADGSVTPPKWTNPYKFRARRTSAQNTGNAAFAIVNFNTEDYDTNNNFDVTTNVGRYTAPVNGYYHFDARLSGTVAGSSQLLIALYKNGSILQRGGHIIMPSGGGTGGVTLSIDVYAVAGDYFNIYSFGSGGAIEISGTETQPYFSGHLISET